MAKSRNPDPIPPGEEFNKNTYYQILYVEPSSEKNEKITKTILAKTRGNDENKDDNFPPSFAQFELDEQTIEKLKDYPRRSKDPKNRLSSYLPSSGVAFVEGFLKSLSKENQQIELANFYVPMRTLLHARKLSQLIAKTWWAYLKAKEGDGALWEQFIAGDWDKMDSDVVDGLIAREIFLFGGGDPPDKIENEEVYLPLKPRETPSEQARFVILPSSRAWQGVSLSLLFAGQAYYKIGDKYHQICQPVFSTGEITIQYSLEVDWNKFQGDIKEIILSQEKPWVGYHVTIPYPPIPDSADGENIKQWAEAEDDGGDFPFYKKTANGEYLIDVDYFQAPYPYIPLSCT